MHEFIIIFHALWQLLTGIIKEFWWILLPFLLFWIFKSLLKKYHQILKIEDSQYSCLEIKFSAEAAQKPLQFLELFFNSLKNIKLEDNQNISLEIVGKDKLLRFILRVPIKIRDLISIALYSQYPNITIVEINDYLNDLPPYIPNKNYDLWYKEYKYKKPSPFPILTYESFFNIQSQMKTAPKDALEQIIFDPYSTLLELLQKAQSQDLIIIQIVIRNLNDLEKQEWDFISKTIYNPLIGKEPPQKPAALGSKILKDFISSMIPAVSSRSSENKGEKPKTLTENDKQLAEKVENKINGINFVTSIRVAYIWPRNHKTEVIPSSLELFIKQFNTTTNALEEISDQNSQLKISKWLPAKNISQNDNYLKLKERRQNKEVMIMSAKELASLFHFPFQNIYFSSIIWEKNKRGFPPQNLPIIHN